MSGIRKPVHLRVTPFWGSERYQDADHRKRVYAVRKTTLEQLARQIERHCDDVDTVEIVYDTLCPYCESPYEAPPYCCDAAQDKWAKDNPRWVLDEDYEWVTREAIPD